MTIDEAIEKHKIMKKASELHNDKMGVLYSAEEHKQISEWLEELKALRNGLKIKCDNLNEALEKGKKIGYKKAIDECLAVLYKNAGKIISIRFYEQIFDEMKQLKAGRENEQSKQNT